MCRRLLRAAQCPPGPPPATEGRYALISPARRPAPHPAGARRHGWRHPALGGSSWSFIRHDPTAADIEAQALAMKKSGLAKAGYLYVNVDDFWYQCPGSQGPNVDEYGRWVIDATKFPPSGSENGI